MADEPPSSTAPVDVQASAEPQLAHPPWFCGAVVVLNHLRLSGLASRLLESFKVPRGRAGTYDAADFVMLLLAFACSNAPDLKAFFKASLPVRDALAALWSRRKVPVRSTLCRFLQAVPVSAVKSLDAFLRADLVADGLPPSDGLVTRTGASYLLFDGDGTRQGIRRRSLPHGNDAPSAQRRAQDSFAGGYLGRKRGEEIRSRFVVMQAHTQEWLGGWLMPGNGQRLDALSSGLDAIKDYVCGRQRLMAHTLLRLDGGHGWFEDARLIRASGAHVLARCVDYRLLHSDAVQARLQASADGTFSTPDSPCQRDWWDVGEIAWMPNKKSTQAPIRLRAVATRRTLVAGESEDASVGIRRGNFVFELFITSLSSSELTGADVLALYHLRGGFERILAQEDAELELDKLVSGGLQGQSAWQLLGMLVWNIRLRLGVCAASAEQRHRVTVLAEAITSQQAAATSAGSDASATGADADGVPSASSVVAAQPPVTAGEQGEPSEAIAASGVSVPGESLDARAESGATEAASRLEAVGVDELGVVSDGEAQAAANKRKEPTEREQRAGEQARRKLHQEGFSLNEAGQLCCPAGQPMREVGKLRGNRPSCYRWEMAARTCRACEKREACTPGEGREGHGRRVHLPMSPQQFWSPQTSPSHEAPTSPAPERAVSSPPRAAPVVGPSPPCAGPLPLLWHDVAGSALRAEVGKKLEQQHVDLEWRPGAAKVAPPRLWTRAERSHARLTWPERGSRNARDQSDPLLAVGLHGLPTALHGTVGAPAG